MSSPKGHCTAISNSQPTLPGNHQDPRQVLVLRLRARDPQLQPLRGQGSAGGGTLHLVPQEAPAEGQGHSNALGECMCGARKELLRGRQRRGKRI